MASPASLNIWKRLRSGDKDYHYPGPVKYGGLSYSSSSSDRPGSVGAPQLTARRWLSWCASVESLFFLSYLSYFFALSLWHVMTCHVCHVHVIFIALLGTPCHNDSGLSNPVIRLWPCENAIESYRWSECEKAVGA